MQVPSLDPDATLALETRKAVLQLISFARRHKYWPSAGEMAGWVAAEGLDKGSVAPLLENALREGLTVKFQGHMRVTARGWKVLKLAPFVALLPDYPRTRANYRILTDVMGGA